MAEQSAYSNTTEAVGVFHSAKGLQAVVDDLLSQGFNRMDLSVLASEEAIAAKLHETYVPVRDLEDCVEVPTTAFISKESIGDAMGAVIGAFIYIPALIGGAAIVASGGTLAAAIAATAIGGSLGGSVGAIMGDIIGKHHYDQIKEHLVSGGLLLWVRTRDQKHEERALSILKCHDAEGVHLHTLPSLLEGGCSIPVEDVVEADSATTSRS